MSIGVSEEVHGPLDRIQKTELVEGGLYVRAPSQEAVEDLGGEAGDRHGQVVTEGAEVVRHRGHRPNQGLEPGQGLRPLFVEGLGLGKILDSGHEGKAQVGDFEIDAGASERLYQLLSHVAVPVKFARVIGLEVRGPRFRPSNGAVAGGQWPRYEWEPIGPSVRDVRQVVVPDPSPLKPEPKVESRTLRSIHIWILASGPARHPSPCQRVAMTLGPGVRVHFVVAEHSVGDVVEARRRADAALRDLVNQGYVIVATEEFPVGWVFIWDSVRHQETHYLRDALLGNAPILVDRRDGSVHSLGQLAQSKNTSRDTFTGIRRTKDRGIRKTGPSPVQASHMPASSHSGRKLASPRWTHASPWRATT
jgi:hypothetical protein